MSALVLLLLAGLAVTDAGFAGYRDAAGRDGRIFKAEYYRAAVRRGLWLGLQVFAFGAVVGLALTLPFGTPARELQVLAQAFWGPLLVGGAYATLVLAALGLWAVGEADLRSLASVVVLGPFTLLRPWVIVAMAVVGAWTAAEARHALAVALPCAAQLTVGWWLGRGWRDGRRPLG